MKTTPSVPAVRVCSGVDSLAEAAAAEIVERLEVASRRRAQVSLAVSGGETPRRLYGLLGSDENRERAFWRQTGVFFSDERCVEPSDPASNFSLVERSLLTPLGLRPSQVHRIHGENPGGAAEAYEEEIRSCLGEEPRLDLVLLGMGADGHTASLFQEDEGWKVSTKWVIEGRAPAEPRRRISLTPRLINRARAVIFLVSGKSKEEAVSRVLGLRDRSLPASWIEPHEGDLVWMLDSSASGGLR